MKKNYSDFAKRNFEYYKAEKRRADFNTMKVFEIVKMFDEIYQDFGIDEDLIKKEKEKNR